MDLYPCIDCGAEPMRVSASGHIEKLECSNPDCDNFEARIVKFEDEFEALEYQWNAANFKSRIKKSTEEIEATPIDDHRRVVCYNSSCTIKHQCAISLPDNLDTRREIIKPGEFVKMRKYKQNLDGSCDELVMISDGE